ncbi:MAG TPA: site-specific integrase, partial [Thermomicrobiales bacterium]|nr:site-specific integrase [Thermomicrobiales bacterium]
VIGLRWEDVDFDQGTIAIRKQLQVINGQPTFTEPKSKMSRRTIPLPPTVMDLLRQHRRQQLEERMRAGERWQAQWGLVFCRSTGTPLDNSNLRKHFKRKLEGAGLPPMRFHDMRHSAASMLAARGVHPSVAQRILGHANINTTLAVYTHVEDAMMRQATDLMGDLYETEMEAN